MKHRRIFTTFLFVCLVSGAHLPIFANFSNTPTSQIVFAEKFFRTELYFGMDKPGGAVTDEEWDKFLADEVTPRFPAGFTVLEALGQYRDVSGKIVKEKSRCLILLYSKKERRASGEKIEQIRAAYKQKFQQESVLRLDFRQTVSVSF